MKSIPAPKENLGQLLHNLWLHIGRRRRTQFVLLVLLMVAASCFEVATIGAVVPFLIALTNPSRIHDSKIAQHAITMLDIQSNDQLLLYLTLAFIVISLAAAIVRIVLLWASTRFSCLTGADISINIYRRTLYQPYLTHVARNSSEVISGITLKANHIIGNVIGPGLTLLSSTLILVSILTTLLLIDYVVALGAFGGFLAIYFSIFRLNRGRLAANSNQNSIEANLIFKVLQEGLGGIRDVLIDGAQETYCKVYKDADLRMRKSQANILFISQWPRYILEGLGMALIALITFLLTKQDGSLTDAIPFLGALALGAQRMLPIVQQAYASWTSIYGSHAQLRETLLLLDQRMPEHATEQAQTPLYFQRGVSLVGVDFQYSPTAPWIFRGLNLFIPKGSRVGVIGETGSGKSTMLDILMGLLVPKEGALKVDDIVITEANRRSWQSAIAHVPQFIFLTDSSAAENIAFGITSDEINIDRVKDAARRAQIAELIESWPEGYATKLGERGIKLSGGQRQRIGIARALYKRAEMIIFDEATSALDSQTEDAVMNAIRSLGSELTLVIIAHRLTTLNICDQVIEVGDQGLLRKGSYAEIVDTKIFKDVSSYNPSD